MAKRDVDLFRDIANVAEKVMNGAARNVTTANNDAKYVEGYTDAIADYGNCLRWLVQVTLESEGHDKSKDQA